MKPTVSIYSYLKKATIIRLTVGLFAIWLIFSLVTFLGFYKHEIKSYESNAILIAQDATILDPKERSLSIAKSTEIILSNSMVSDINIYGTDQNKNNIKKLEYNFIDALFSKSIHISEPIYIYNQNSENIDNNQSHQMLLGYVILVVDLYELRMHWFKDYQWFFYLTLVLYLVLAMYLFGWVYAPFRRLQEASDIHFDLNDQETLLQMPYVDVDVDFQETTNIQVQFNQMLDYCNKLKTELNTLNNNQNLIQGNNEARGEQQSYFQNMITHELKTSLNTITGGIHLLEQQYLTDEQKDATQVISEGSQQLNFFLMQILQLNQFEKGNVSINKVEFNPRQVIDTITSIYSELAIERNVRLVQRVEHMNQTLVGDVQKIEQILSLLVDNAFDFTEFGTISITSTLQYLKKKIRWIIKVQDTGIGIEKKQLDKIFLPFYQLDSGISSRVGGVGIGLSIAQRLADAMDGKISVESRSGEGSTFTLTVILNDVEQHNTSELLTDVDITIYEEGRFTSLATGFRNLGANLDIYNNLYSLLDNFDESGSDVLIISSDIDVENTEKLVKKVRANEKHSRCVIFKVCSEKDINTYNARYLQILGIDEVLSESLSDMKMAQSITDWLDNVKI